MSGFHMNGRPCEATKRACPLLGTEEHFEGSAEEFAAYLIERDLAQDETTTYSVDPDIAYLQQEGISDYTVMLLTDDQRDGLMGRLEREDPALRSELDEFIWNSTLSWEERFAFYSTEELLALAETDQGFALAAHEAGAWDYLTPRFMVPVDRVLDHPEGSFADLDAADSNFIDEETNDLLWCLRGRYTFPQIEVLYADHLTRNPSSTRREFLEAEQERLRVLATAEQAAELGYGGPDHMRLHAEWTRLYEADLTVEESRRVLLLGGTS